MMYLIVVFRSRKETMDLRSKLESKGINAETINTPRSLCVGCGISLRIDIRSYTLANLFVTQSHYNSFIGFYRYDSSGKLVNM